MGAVRHWRRATLGGAAVALLLPLAVGVALLGSAAVGGQHTLRSLGQVLAGPSAPGRIRGTATPGLESARAVPSLPPGPRLHASAAGRAAVGAGTSAPALGGGGRSVSPHRSGSGGPSAGINAPAHHGSGSGSGQGPPSGPPSPGASGGSTPAPPPAPQRSPVHAVGQQVADTAKALPAPVGPAAGDAVQTVVDLLP